MYVLRRENGDVLYFDAVTNIEEMYTSTVTKHPVATGGYISDHTTKDNKKFTLSAVLSDADFNLDRPSLSTDPRLVESQLSYRSYELNPETGLYDILKTPRTQQKQYQNNTPTNTTVTIKTDTTSTWKKFLPETISQFTKDNIPTVEVMEQSKVKTAQAVRDELIMMWENKENFTLMEYDGSTVNRFWDNMVFTRLSFAQDANTGLGLFPEMSMEKVQYTDVTKVPITIRKVNNKGRKSGEVTKKTTEEGDNAQTEETKLAKKSALQRIKDTAEANSEAQQ